MPRQPAASTPQPASVNGSPVNAQSPPESPSFFRQMFRFDTDRAEPLHSLLCLPAVALPLFVLIPLGYPGTAALMAGGAQSVGFGSYQQPLWTRTSPMLFASLLMSGAAVVGALCRDSTVALLAAGVVLAFLYGLANAVSTATAWVCQQGCVFLVISSAAPSTPGTTHDLVTSALLRGAGVLAGGLLQTLSIVLLRRRFPEAQSRFTSPDFDPRHLKLHYLADQIKPGSGYFQFGLRMIVTSAVAILVSRLQSFPSAYWTAMTAMLLPKPEWTATAQRSLLRLAGTLIGAAVCTAIVTELRPRGEVLSLLVLAFLFGAYLLLNVNYGAFAICITGYVCFLLAISRQPPREVLWHRVEATSSGALIVIGIHLAFILVRQLLGITVPVVRSLEDTFDGRVHNQRES